MTACMDRPVRHGPSRRLSGAPVATLVLGLIGASALAAGPSAPQAVSPASDAGLAIVEARCPTFSWTSVANQDGYELVVYRLQPAAAADAKIAAQPVLSVRVPAAANSWTPTLERCLAVGERYAWSIRPRGAQSEWSEPSFFEIAPPVSQAALDQAVALLRREISAGSDPASAPTRARPAESAHAADAAHVHAAAPKTAQGTPTFAVDGSGNVSAASVSAGSFTGSGSGLTGVNAVTAAALAANGSNCGPGQVAIGIDASGNAEGCLGVLFPADLDAHAAGGAHDARYLRLTGGTLTGPLVAPSFQGDGSALTGIVASSAQALAANGGNCTPGTSPLGVSASGAAEDCFDVTTDDEFISHFLGGHDSRYLQLAGGTLTGALSATSFSGNGAGLTNVAAATAVQADNATTANALGTNPANCAAGTAALGVAANGAAEGCFDVATQGELGAHANPGTGTDHDLRYLRLTGGALTGSLTINGASLTVDGPIFSRCPTSTPVTGSTAQMDRVGSWCIDHRPRNAAVGSTSVLNCHDAGMSVCSMEVLFACDAGNYGAGANSCGAVTDNVGSVIRTISIDRTGTGSVFNQLLKFTADGNTIAACADSESLQYFCCRPISAF